MVPQTHNQISRRLQRCYRSLIRGNVAYEQKLAQDGLDAISRRKWLEEIASPGYIFTDTARRPNTGFTTTYDRAIIAVMEGEEDGLDLLYHSFYWLAADLYIDVAACKMVDALCFGANFNKVALILAQALTLGVWTEAEQIAEAIRYGLAHRNSAAWKDIFCLIQFVEYSHVAPFVLNLYAQWSGTSFPLEGLPLQSIEKYEPLLSLWQTEDLHALETALWTACDYHMERSKYTEDIGYEFTLDAEILYPIEILSVLRLRESRGLTNPVVDHPLLKTPIGQLHQIKQVPHDELLDRAVANYIASIPSATARQRAELLEKDRSYKYVYKSGLGTISPRPLP